MTQTPHLDPSPFVLPGGPVGKGHGGDRPRRDPELDQPGDAMRNDSGFPRTGAGQDQQRPGPMLDRFALGRVQMA